MIGCLFLFEDMLVCEGIGLCYVEEGCNVLMYCMLIVNCCVGIFGG